MSGSPRHRAGRSHPSEALEGKAGIGKLALYGREYSVAIQPRGKGLVMYTLRRAKEAEVALARQVIGNFEGEIDLGDFEDEYQAELRSVIDAKIAGEEFVVQEEEAPAKVVDLMAALRKSLDSVSQSKKTPARSATAAKATKAKRKRA
jgi:DNA end-binding protein Ku